MINRYFLLFLFVSSQIVLSSCGIYSFKGSTLSPEVKTISIQPFTNEASLVVPSLANKLTEKLKDKFNKEMNLSNVNQDGDLAFSGVITSYKTGPASVTSDEVAASTRLSVTVKVKYENIFEPATNYDVTFSSYIDFDSKQDLSSVEDQLLEELTETLVQDIFNRAVNNW